LYPSPNVFSTSERLAEYEAWMGKWGMHAKWWSENLNGRDGLGDVDMRTDRLWRDMVWGCGMGLFGSGRGQMAALVKTVINLSASWSSVSYAKLWPLTINMAFKFSGTVATFLQQEYSTK
jgi:hypothetical protein